MLAVSRCFNIERRIETVLTEVITASFFFCEENHLHFNFNFESIVILVSKKFEQEVKNKKTRCQVCRKVLDLL